MKAMQSDINQEIMYVDTNNLISHNADDGCYITRVTKRKSTMESLGTYI